MHGVRVVAMSDRRRQGAQGPGRPDARVARPRVERPRRGRIYAEFVTDFVLDTVDAALAAAIEALGLRAHVTDTIMTDDAGRARLAAEVLGGRPWRLIAA